MKFPGKMAQKSKVSCLSVLKEDPATRSGMINVLQSLASFNAINPVTGKTQSRMVAGDYGFFEMGEDTI